MSTRSPALAAGREAEDDRPAIAPFWHRLNSFFLFPFQMEPLIYAALLALASYLLFLPGIIKFFTVLGLVLGASRYAFKVAALASRGVLHSRDYTNALTDPDWKVLPWKFFGVLVVHGMLIGFLGRQSEVMGIVASLISSLLLPVGVFAAVYFLWVMASLIGYVMYQHHGALEIDLLREPEPDAASAAARRVKPEAQVRDAEVSALVQKSDLKEAASGVLA